jgi:hypothetical protein
MATFLLNYTVVTGPSSVTYTRPVESVAEAVRHIVSYYGVLEEDHGPRIEEEFFDVDIASQGMTGFYHAAVFTFADGSNPVFVTTNCTPLTP